MMHEFDESDVAEVLTPAVARAIVRDALIAAALGRASNPLRAVATPPGGWFAAMPAYVDTGELRALGAKMVCVFPENARRGLATHRATIVLFDPDDGTPVASVAGDAITLRRTAAASIVAAQALAAKPAGTYAILGAGAQGRAHVEALLAAEMVTSLRIWSRSAERALALASAAAERVSVVVADSPDEAVTGADGIVTTTASPAPLFEASNVARHAHITAVGACVPAHRELPGELVAQAALYVDSREGALREAGDLLLAMADCEIDAGHIRAEIGSVLVEGTPIPRDRPTIYESLGLGIFDVACAAYVLQASIEDRNARREV